jgi:hypothetical protein
LRYARTALVSVGGLILTLASTAPASAATYDGQDPDASGCSATAKTVASATLKDGNGAVVGSVELRYSTSCRTVWARVNGPFNKTPRATIPGAYGWVVRNSDGKTLAVTHSSGSQTQWTNMLNDAGATSYARGQYDDSNTATQVRTANY